MTAVLVVDDQPIFRRAASALVTAAADLHLVGAAASGEEAVELAARLRPDAVVMDVRLPGIDGLEATRRILATQPHVRVVLVSSQSEGDLPPDLGRCGAVGFVGKQMLTVQRLSALLVGGASNAADG